MTEALHHRGPDDGGTYIDRNVALGHRRLAILDLTDAGKQPMISEDQRYVIVFNGEIYNHQELRSQLVQGGIRFHSRTDTEVILYGFRQWGKQIVSKLNGMFAFVIWDSLEGTLTIVRDRYGMKPLYYYQHRGDYIFASEIKAILKYPDYQMDINYEALNEYFTFQNIFQSHTMFKGISLVQPGTITTIREGEIKQEVFWDYNFVDRQENLKLEEAHSETLRLLRQSVLRQMVADVPVGSYLSGGLDSGSITAIASSYKPRITTFTCGFDLSATTGRELNFDERRDAELMASSFQTEHYEMVIHAGDLSWSLPQCVWHLEDLRLGMSYPNFYIARLASKFVKVVLSGAGGDELYGGYPWRYYRVVQSLDKELFFRDYYNFWQRLVDDSTKPQLFTESVWAKIPKTSMFEVFKYIFHGNESLKFESAEEQIANCLYFEAKTFLHGLFLVGDKLAMAHSLEERFPFMDNDLVEFAQSVPIRLKLSKFESMQKVDENEERKIRRFQLEFDEGKNVLRKAMGDLLPSQILNRTKQGFSAPDESWYRGENYRYVRNLLLRPNAAYRDIIRPSFVQQVLEEHVRGTNHRLLIWSLLCFEWWCRIFLNGERPSS
jgi:asparagine synthase (glutamine-hydrolysing)